MNPSLPGTDSGDFPEEEAGTEQGPQRAGLSFPCFETESLISRSSLCHVISVTSAYVYPLPCYQRHECICKETFPLLPPPKLTWVHSCLLKRWCNMAQKPRIRTSMTINSETTAISPSPMSPLRKRPHAIVRRPQAFDSLPLRKEKGQKRNKKN